MTNLSNHHKKSITKALRYIENNLEADLSLDAVSSIANYSPYYFHRLFKAFTAETINAYVTRKRIEKSASVLLRNKEVSVSELSFRYSFTSNSSFTRAFKKYYGLNPTDFRRNSHGKYSKIRQVISKIGQVTTIFEPYVCESINIIQTSKMNDHINVKTIDPLHFACITFIGKHNSSKAFTELLSWAAPEGLLQKQDFKLGTIFYDSLKITAHDKARFSAALLLDEPLKPSEEIDVISFQKSKYIISHFEIGMDEFEKSWSSMFIWMNDNGFKKTEQPAFQIYHNDFNGHPEKKCVVNLYIPVY